MSKGTRMITSECVQLNRYVWIHIIINVYAYSNIYLEVCIVHLSVCIIRKFVVIIVSRLPQCF